MNRRAMFAQVAGAALGAIAAKVGLLDSLTVSRAVPGYSLGTVGGMNIPNGGVTRQYRYLDAGWRQWHYGRWNAARARAYLDRQVTSGSAMRHREVESVLSERRNKWEAFMRGDHA